MKERKSDQPIQVLRSFTATAGRSFALSPLNWVV